MFDRPGMPERPGMPDRPGICCRPPGSWPFAMLAIADGQYIWIAMVANMLAISGDIMALLPRTRDTAAAKFPLGWASIGQRDWPIASALPASPKLTPALDSAEMNASSTGLASAGA